VTPAKEKGAEPQESSSGGRYYNATSLPIDMTDGSMLLPDAVVEIEAMDGHTTQLVRLGMLVEVKEEAK
jgi:hypothetical protein